MTIDKDYFRLRKPTERRLYELARKHCGNQIAWKINLVNLKEKIGVTSQMKLLRFNIKKITETNHLPEYNISMENDVVMFSRKEPPKENNALAGLPKHVTKKEIEKYAKPGESYEQAANRIKTLKNCQPQVEMSGFLQSRSDRFLYFLKFISIYYYCPTGV